MLEKMFPQSSQSTDRRLFQGRLSLKKQQLVPSFLFESALLHLEILPTTIISVRRDAQGSPGEPKVPAS